MDPNTSIIIVGGGIGGLVTALQLHADGFTNIDIFESAPKLLGIGVGINIQPSAVLILRNLNLLTGLEEVGIKTATLNFYNRFGSKVFAESRGEAAGYLVPQLSIHRGMLHQVLLSAVKERLGEHRLHTDHEFRKFSQDRQHITGYFSKRSNSSISADIPSLSAQILIAADGINSKARSLIYPDEGPPNFSGRLLWRGVSTRAPFLSGVDMIWSGHADQKFIAYPISEKVRLEGKSMVNWIAELRVRKADDPDKKPPVADWGKSVPKDRFAPDFKDWTFGFLNVPELIEETDIVYEFPMCDRDPVDHWSVGRLTLLGDAAHPLYPIGSNGASQAILDALALSESLQKHSDVPSALKDYESMRLPSTARICYANRGNGPDHVLQLAHEKAPDGFANIDDVIPKETIEEVGRVYKELAGFDMISVNQKAKATEGTAGLKGLKSPVLHFGC